MLERRHSGGAVDPRAISLARPSRRASDGRSRHAARGRELGIHKQRPEKSMAWPVFMVSGPGPHGPSRNDRGFFRILSDRVVHLEFDRVGRLFESADLRPFEFHVGADLVFVENVASQ